MTIQNNYICAANDSGNFDEQSILSLLDIAKDNTIMTRKTNSMEWEKWSTIASDICDRQFANIEAIVNSPNNQQAKQIFDNYKQELQIILGDNIDIDETDAINILAFHIVIMPVLETLFSDYPFTEINPLAHVISNVVEKLEAQGLIKSNQEELKVFYNSIKLRLLDIKSLAERQIMIADFFDIVLKNVSNNLPKKSGFFSTPIEVVDFINNSVNDILKKDFGVGLADHNVHVLDPFTGTGSFITRLMQNRDLIPEDKLPYKYEHELHAFELNPLAYYVASMNLESAYHELCKNSEPKANKIISLTDTFDFSFKDKNASLVNNLPIKVILGNPPVSVGQMSADEQNDRHPNLELRIAETYVKYAKSSLMKGLYDSYVKAFRWASDQVEHGGVVAFVTNAGWIESNVGGGIRQAFVEEFDDIYVYHLKGNRRHVGEESKKQGDNIFGFYFKFPIAITILVKKPNRGTEQKQPAKIYFATVGDSLTREQKLFELLQTKSILNTTLTEFFSDSKGNWLHLE